MLKITKEQINDQPLQLSKCGEWVTNRHWSVLVEHCPKRVVAAADTGPRPSMSEILEPLPRDQWVGVEDTGLQFNGVSLLLGAENLEIWLTSAYTEMSKHLQAHPDTTLVRMVDENGAIQGLLQACSMPRPSALHIRAVEALTKWVNSALEPR